jgi:hypothetical protein
VRCASALLLSAVCGARAAPAFRSDRKYPDLGLRFRVLANAQPEPLAQAKTYSYTFTRGSESFQRDLFDPAELWLATQHAGQWRDEDGNVLTLGRPTRLCPVIESETKHVSREAFDRALDGPAAAFAPDRPAALAAWVARFADCTPRDPEPLRTGFNLTDALFFPVSEPSVLVYAFRVKTRGTGGAGAPSDWFCAVIRIGDRTPKAKVRHDFESQFLANVAWLPQSAAAAAAGVRPKTLALGPVSGAGAPAAIPEHPGREAARKSIANMKDWWFAETPEYLFLSDIRSSAGKALVKELQETLPALRAGFARLVPPFEDADDVSVVRIYESREAYQQYVGKAYAWSAGLWSPMRRELVIAWQGRNRDQTLTIIRHEALHQYLFYAGAMTEHAAWFNEGHACFFETATVDAKGRVAIPENPRVDHLMRNLDKVTNHLPHLLQTGHKGFYQGSDEQRELNYTAAWALVYYLRKGAPAEKESADAALPGAYLKALAQTRKAEAATAAAFEGVNMALFQRRFTKFWQRGRNRARRYDPFESPAAD